MELFRESSFHPDAKQNDVRALSRAFERSRQTKGEWCIAACSIAAPDTTRSALSKECLDWLDSKPHTINALYIDPVFSTWMQFFLRATARQLADEIKFHAARLPIVLARAKQRLEGKDALYVGDTSISLQQMDIDPYLMAVTPPSYDFVKLLQGAEKNIETNIPAIGQKIGHPLPLQSELTSLAMLNIEKSWPALYVQIIDVVKIVGYLPDATFRSCSAARFAGVIYLGNMDERLLDIEESLVHEAGHQVLYRLAELVPLVKPDTPRTADYTLPWSGSKRDLFGFLHAYYIYTLLSKYFWHRASLNTSDAQDCLLRSLLILVGSLNAAEMLLDDANLSEQGRVLVKLLHQDMLSLQEQMAPYIQALLKQVKGAKHEQR